MALRHILVIRFTDDTTDEQVDEFAAALDGLPQAIPQIRSYRHGRDAGIRESSWDYGLVAEYDSADDFQTYLAHPAHQQIVQEILEPISAQRASVQMTL
jgi:hypothetical protein